MDRLVADGRHQPVSEERLIEDPLSLPLTRPAMMPLLGVPLPLGILLIVCFGLIIALLHNPLYAAVMGPLWWISKLLVAQDYNAPGIFLLYLQTSAGALDAPLWGGASLSPMPIRVPPRGRGMLQHDDR